MKVRRQKSYRIWQGDVYKDVEFVEYVVEKEGNIEVSKIIFPLVVVLTQDCDLAQDCELRYGRRKARPKTQDKLLLSVLVAPLYNVEHVYSGEHLSRLDISMQTIDKKRSPGRNLKNNETPRYHYIDFPPEVSIVTSVIDFKHYFSVNVEYLKRIKKRDFVCRIAPLYREDISQRFASFLSRIALP